MNVIIKWSEKILEMEDDSESDQDYDDETYDSQQTHVTPSKYTS